MPHGVGIIGAGPGVAALHLPTLAHLADDFRVTHVSDAGSGRAEGLAARVGARASVGIDELLADPEVDIVAICSPPGEHAAQIILHGGSDHFGGTLSARDEESRSHGQLR